MKTIHILTFGNPVNLSETTKNELELFKKAAIEQNLDIKIIYGRECQLLFGKKPGIIIPGEKIKNIRNVLVRANFLDSDPEYHTSIIRQFSLLGARLFNNQDAIARAKNKVRMMQILSKNGVPIPKTYTVRSASLLDELINDIGKLPVVIKTTAGSHGIGVSIVETKRALRSLIEMLIKNDQHPPLIVQEYIKESKGKDIRVFIVGKKILGAMERVATRKGEFRSNFKLGGRVRVAELSREEKRVAFKAVSAIGLDVAGVDILRTSSGPKVIEVNANPGLEGITKATGRDIAGKILKFCTKD